MFLRNGTNQTRLKLFQFLQLLNHGGYFYSSGIKAIKIIDSCRTVYAVHSNAYEHHNVVVLNSVFRPIDIVKKFDVVFAPSALNGGKSYKYVDVNSLLDSYKDLFEILEKKRYRNILLKFHPNQSALVKDFIRKESSKRTRLNFIEVVDVSIESICSSKRTIVISDMSSVLLYSAQLGSETYTINDLIVNRDQRYIEVLKHLPSKLIKTFKSISELPDNYKLHE